MEVIAKSQIELEAIRTFYSPYLNDVETTVLVALVKSVAPKVMIEIGCQAGRTAKTILTHVPSLEVYVGVDVPWRHEPTLKCQRSEVPLNAGIYASDDPRFYLLVKEGGSQALGPMDLEPCDVVFIDGDHSEHAVTHDSYLARALVRPGGIIIWHDYNNPTVEVTAVLHKLYDEGWPIIHVEGTWLAYWKT